METCITLDDKLVEQAVKLGKHKTKKEAVTAAHEEYTRIRKQSEIEKHFGKIEFDANYYYKKQRKIK